MAQQQSIAPPPRRYTVKELQRMRDHALDVARQNYDSQRRAVLKQFQEALAQNGHAPARKAVS